MQIFVSYPQGSTRAYEVDSDTSVESLKLMVENQTFIPSGLCRLVDANSTTLTGGSLAAMGIEEDDTVTLMLDVEGGMRRKWRKKRMRRLRRKRRKMGQRAR
uniref:60S ribosomal protein L41 n=1 Tax=Leptocylindrus danicus TaxID=163516 RepID=A0A7S2LPW7_9STRA|mmetsp:Transcript_849/g.1193  ORF Transcript_849/g.1193 Transcript_849/m.1193 type:complete len:102 (+) Transcript_849:51-356(+)